ncbi:putative membrane protein [Geomicrobium halophilum]|uniref:Putative membrane protein n=1 Tax=Geomicrobium halophilum TaxID=549000 RepID=A0A841Q091_9BACL|nr:small-conductance mechanosensitive channel [Geomicrobium halophilum]MBB6450782.1 putative membrane protein [Geomicrobium halophilum]
MDTFHHQAHFWGRLTLIGMIIATLMAPFYLSFVLGAHPGWETIIAGLIGYAAFIGVMWVLEPITYYPTLGIAGTYMAFMQGNVANLCLPCSASAQSAVNAETGSRKAEIAGTIGIAVACLVNISAIVVVILSGAYIVSILPPAVEAAFNFVLPAIFGAILGQFAYKTPLYGGIALAIGIIVLFSPIPDTVKIVFAVILTVSVIVLLERRKDKRQEEKSTT